MYINITLISHGLLCRDVDPQVEIPPALESLICRAEALGKLSQVNADGVLPDRRLNLAMGLASIHIGQYFEVSGQIRAVNQFHCDMAPLLSWSY